MVLIAMTLTIESVNGHRDSLAYTQDVIVSTSSDMDNLISPHENNNSKIVELNFDYDTHMQKVKDAYDSMEQDITHSLVLLLFMPVTYSVS